MLFSLPLYSFLNKVFGYLGRVGDGYKLPLVRVLVVGSGYELTWVRVGMVRVGIGYELTG